MILSIHFSIIIPSKEHFPTVEASILPVITERFVQQADTDIDHIGTHSELDPEMVSGTLFLPEKMGSVTISHHINPAEYVSQPIHATRMI